MATLLVIAGLKCDRVYSFNAIDLCFMQNHLRMTQKKHVRISFDPGRKNKYYKEHSEGYGFQNGEFVFSDNISDWMIGKTRKFKQQSQPLF